MVTLSCKSFMISEFSGKGKVERDYPLTRLIPQNTRRQGEENRLLESEISMLHRASRAYPVPSR